jgi:transcriptional antiterminator RfaH
MSYEGDQGWVVLRTQLRHELLAAGAVVARGVESYIPFIKPKRPSDPTLPLFPGYVFARVNPATDDLLRIRSAPGIAYPLPRGGAPMILPDLVIDLIRERLAECPEGLAAVELQHGDRVQLIAGPFRWMDAVFDRRMSAAGRVRVLLELAHRTIQLNIQETQLKRA